MWTHSKAALLNAQDFTQFLKLRFCISKWAEGRDGKRIGRIWSGDDFEKKFYGFSKVKSIFCLEIVF